MPTYSYHCEKCGKKFTRVEAISAHDRHKVACPKCHSRQVSQVLRPFFAKTSKKS
jgi:putative FmdB family regulatory protein